MQSDSPADKRKAPYAPVSALHEFLDKMRDLSVPARVDRNYLQRLNVASNNEWAFLSALKYLGIIDDSGVPTHAYRLLQTSDQFKPAWRHLVETAYAPLLALNGLHMDHEDLVNYFRRTSSASQAKNAARFFREAARIAGLDESEQEAVRRPEPHLRALPIAEPAEHMEAEEAGSVSQNGSVPTGEGAASQTVLPAAPPEVLLAKARLLDKLPMPRDDWSAADYQAIYDRFLQMLAHLDGA